MIHLDRYTVTIKSLILDSGQIKDPTSFIKPQSGPGSHSDYFKRKEEMI